MSSTTRNALLKLALPLIKDHGFTRSALSLAVMYSPSGKHTAPLNDTAVDALFGEGDEARRTLMNAWLDDARVSLRKSYSQDSDTATTARNPSLGNVLKTRLSKNEGVLEHLPEAFALLATPPTLSSLIFPLTLDPRPAISHSMSVAAEACKLSCDTSVGATWYTRRATIGAIYTAAELHQLYSPTTAHDFLDRLLEESQTLGMAVDETFIYAKYIVDAWKGIITSRGITP
ncbi:hypothetical protein BJ322DRAFT_1090875 [Thelephora terrestris]|uniref:COQ9 C-terminal domain-containing protein n=1 Tax=Thelephora terrestris TaxID=56493 RepID=A0A9P6H450_9AGAM|nr:hypothetical protein BJ322DRAFT_1090875 [Thelephora terrestris]